MKRVLVIILLLSTSIILEINACSCINVPKTFSENIKANHIIFLGTVLEQIVIQNDSNYLLLYHGLTKIQVNKWYQNNMKSDTIYYANGHEAMCISSVEHLKEGDQVLIKANKESIYEPALELYPNVDNNLFSFIDSYRHKPIVGYGICDVGLLEVKDQVVIGNITKNHQYRKWRRINFIRKISQKWADTLETKIHKDEPKYQKWRLKRFTKLMNAKWITQ